MMISWNMVDYFISFLSLHFSVSPRPLGFGFGTLRFGDKGWGPGPERDNMMFLQSPIAIGVV